MLISALGGNITGSVFFNLLQPSVSNPSASQVNVPLQTIPQANPNPTYLLALGDQQIDNLALGLPINAISGDSAYYLQQETNVVYGNSSGGFIPLGGTPGIYYLTYVYALAYSNLLPSSVYYFYQEDLYNDVRKYLATHSAVGEDINQLIQDFQEWDASLMKSYNIQPIRPAACKL